MKKLFCLILSLIFVLSLTACGSSAASENTAGASPEEANGVKTEFKVAIVQQLDHSSLDEIRTAIEAELNALAEPTNYTITIETYNGQNDASMLNQIGTEVVSDDVDMIIPIATLAAQSMVTAADGTDIPIVYAAISDPEGAGLTDIPNVTGVSDALNTNFIMDMMFVADPKIQVVGLLYSNSEINSEGPIRDAKAYLDAKGIAYVEKTGNTASEIIAAASDLIGRADAVFTPTDNVVMATEAAVAEMLSQANVPHYTGADSFVTSGAFATCGVNYTELGAKTAQIAFDILMGGEIGEYHVMEGGIITINSETAAMLSIRADVFNKMANTIITVTTAAQ